MATIETLFKIVASVAGANAVKGLSDEIKSMSSTSQNMVRGFTQVSMALKGFAMAQATREIAGFVTAAIDLGDELNDMAQRTGIAVSELGKYKIAAELNGASLETVAKSVNKLNKSLIDAADGSGATAAAFKSMNISVKDAGGQIKNADTIMLEISDKFKTFPDGPTKAALAMAIFGKAGADMIPMLNQGSEELKKYGLVIDQDFATASDGFHDRLTLMSTGVKQFGIDTAKILLPALNDAVDQMSGLIDTQGMWEGFSHVVSDTIRAVSGSIVVLVEQIKNLVAGLKLIGSAAYGVYQIATGNKEEGIAVINAAWDDAMKQWTANEKKSVEAAEQFYDNSYIYGNGNKKSQAGAATNTRTGSTPNFNPTGSANSDAVEKEARKKIAMLNADTGAVGMNNKEREKAILLAEFEAKGLSKSSDLYQKLSDAIDKNTASHRSFEAGAFKALNDYMDTVSNIAAQTENVFSDSFKGMEDAFVKFTTTGKLSFSDMASSIINDLARIVVRQNITGPLAGLFSKGLGSLFGNSGLNSSISNSIAANPAFFANGGIMTSQGSIPLNRYAGGGIANSPQLAMFGEGRMNEAYVPLPDGKTIPVTMKGGGGDNINVTVNMDGSSDVQADGEKGAAFGKYLASTVKSIMLNEKRPGGLLAA